MTMSIGSTCLVLPDVGLACNMQYKCQKCHKVRARGPCSVLRGQHTEEQIKDDHAKERQLQGRNFTHFSDECWLHNAEANGRFKSPHHDKCGEGVRLHVQKRFTVSHQSAAEHIEGKSAEEDKCGVHHLSSISNRWVLSGDNLHSSFW